MDAKHSINNKENDENKGESIFLNKYFALFLMVCSTLGQNFVYDNPAGKHE